MISKHLLGFIDKVFNGERPQNIPVNVHYEYEIKYGEDEMHVADLFRPLDGGINGVILNIHGGGFIAGCRKGLREFCGILASHGYFVFSIDYPLAPRKIHPHPISSTLDALRYLADNAEELGINIDNVFLTGDSAGCYFAAYAIAALNDEAVRAKLFGDEYNGLTERINISGCMLYCGIYCMDTAMRTFPRFIFGDMVREYFGLKSREYWRHGDRESLSPIRIINGSFPPALIVYAGKDPVKKQSVMMIERLKESGVEADGYFEAKGGHDFQLSLHKEHAKKCMAYTLEWLDNISNR